MMDKSWTNIGHKFVQVLTSVKLIGQKSKNWTNVWHRHLTKNLWIIWQSLDMDKVWTTLGQILDICPILVQYLSSHPFPKSTMFFHFPIPICDFSWIASFNWMIPCHSELTFIIIPQIEEWVHVYTEPCAAAARACARSRQPCCRPFDLPRP